jgi:hypothetical protein
MNGKRTRQVPVEEVLPDRVKLREYPHLPARLVEEVGWRHPELEPFPRAFEIVVQSLHARRGWPEIFWHEEVSDSIFLDRFCTMSCHNCGRYSTIDISEAANVKRVRCFGEISCKTCGHPLKIEWPEPWCPDYNPCGADGSGEVRWESNSTQVKRQD